MNWGIAVAIPNSPIQSLNSSIPQFLNPILAHQFTISLQPRFVIAVGYVCESNLVFEVLDGRTHTGRSGGHA